jgi:hypothetical protein
MVGGKKKNIDIGYANQLASCERNRYNGTMNSKAWWLLPIICGALLAGVMVSSTQAQDNARYFYETGHWVQGEFLVYYDSSPYATLLYGFPTTQEFTDNLGKRVQYFQKARFEYNPNAPAGKRITLTALGVLVYQPQNVKPADHFPTNTPECSPYTSKDFGTFYVCYAFRDFYNRYGGLAQFGYPITNYVREGNLYVQYFERARFEYHPELSSNNWVKLTNIGSIQFDISPNAPRLKDPEKLSGPFIAIPPKVIDLKVRAFVDRAVVTNNRSQTLYVVVLDQNSQELAGATVKVTLYLPDGTKESFSLPVSDIDGISLWKFKVDAQQPNQVYLIQVEASYNNLSTKTSTWFRTWW